MKYSEIKEVATKLRNNPTKEEEFLWQYLRNRKLMGKKFLRQHPIIHQTIWNEHFFYIPDFYCSELKLAIELDGGIHLKRIEDDRHRDEVLNSLGVEVLRIKNVELENIEAVLRQISICVENIEKQEVGKNTPLSPLCIGGKR